MAIPKGSGNLQRDLNHSMPAADAVRLGDLLADIIANLNALTTQAALASYAQLTTLKPVRTLATAPPAPEIAGDRP